VQESDAIFQSCILAYNLMVWMMWLTSEKSFHEEPDTIRSWFIHVPATVVSTARRLILKLSEHYAMGGNRKILICPEFCLTRFGYDILAIHNTMDKYPYFMVIFRYH